MSTTIDELKKRSIEVILDGQTSSGAYLAGPRFSVYKFSWFRDGSFIADAMSRVGEIESAENFFDWTSKVICARRERIRSGEHLHARYTAEGKESVMEWPTFQLDGFGTLLWAMHEHGNRHKRSLERWKDTIGIIAEYLSARWKEPSHDWWEEESGIHPATLASIYAGLEAAGHSEARSVKETLTLKNARLDASLIACATPFHAVSAQKFAPVLRRIETRLVSPSGGVHRHESDVYYGGGEWLLLTCFLGWHYAETGRADEAREKLHRVAALMDENGWLPEQVSEHMLSPEHLEAWNRKWGPSAKPLLWSHAMFLTLANVLDGVSSGTRKRHDSITTNHFSMARGDKSKYTEKQKRKAEHIEEGYEERGVSRKEAQKRAWATVNKIHGGGEKSGSGRGKPENRSVYKKGGKKGGKASASRTKAEKSASAKKAARTRKRNAGRK